MLPPFQSPAAFVKMATSFIGWQLENTIWKTCPPVSISKPIVSGLLYGDLNSSGKFTFPAYSKFKLNLFDNLYLAPAANNKVFSWSKIPSYKFLWTKIGANWNENESENFLETSSCVV